MTDSGTTTGLQDKVMLAARLLVVPLFTYSGIQKILAFGATAARLPGGEGGFGSFLASGTVVIELGCSLLPVLGLWSRCAALVLIGYTILATLMFHNFWASPPAQVMAQTINFGKNLGLIGLFLMVWAFGPGAYALKR